MADEAIDAFRRELEQRLAGRSERDQKHLFLGILNKWIPAQARPILVGGSLVEYYSLGAITSFDIDLVGDRRVVGAYLEGAGFRKQDRHWIHPSLPLMVEVAGRDIRPTEVVKTLKIEEFTFLAVSPEDAIVDRLVAAEHWKSRTDWERAVVLASALAGEIDWDILMARAQANDSRKSAEELRRLLKA